MDAAGILPNRPPDSNTMLSNPKLSGHGSRTLRDRFSLKGCIPGAMKTALVRPRADWP